MKKIAYLLLFVFSFSLFVQYSYAHEEPLPLSATESAAVSKDKEVEGYQLPYPGILPDSPFYQLKTARDRIIGFLIADPLKKAEFNLLQADKRLNAGVYLINKRSGKEDLAISTISKGQNYFEQAIDNVGDAKQQGMDVSDMAKRLHLASRKHESVLRSLEKGTLKSKKGLLTGLLQRTSDLQKKVSRFLPKA